jgi:hypothetical protein
MAKRIAKTAKRAMEAKGVYADHDALFAAFKAKAAAEGRHPTDEEMLEELGFVELPAFPETKPTTKIAKQVVAAKKMIAAVDAAEAAAKARGRELTDKELVKLGYVEKPKGCFSLPISSRVALALVKEGFKR